MSVRTGLKWSLLSVWALSMATCSGERGVDVEPGNPDGGSASLCSPGVDSDLDGLTNDYECMIGTNPRRSDTDGDGLWDGVEVRYPKMCVAQSGQLTPQKQTLF